MERVEGSHQLKWEDVVVVVVVTVKCQNNKDSSRRSITKFV